MNKLEKNIDTFFIDMKSILTDECDGNCDECKNDICIKTNKPKIEEIKEQRTNVIYLNTDCNLRCTYCYEGSSRNGLPDQADCNPDMIDDFFDEIINREKDTISTIVVMGGEPFLRFDLIQYTIARAIQLSRIHENKGFGISLITNGTLFNEKRYNDLKFLIEEGSKSNVSVSLEISYDCSGHHKRQYPDGTSSRDLVEKTISTLIEKDIEFKISYTVHSGNYDKVVNDTIYMLERFKSNALQRITIGYAYQELDKQLNGQNVGFNLKQMFIPHMENIFKKYQIPICGHVCHICKTCDKQSFIGNSYLSPTTGITYDEKKTEHEFRQF